MQTLTGTLSKLGFAVALLTMACESFSTGTSEQTIVVDVGEFRNYEGNLGCRLYKSAEGFPEGRGIAIEQTVKIVSKRMTCEFRNLAPGFYAVAVMHDENQNQQLDKNFLGIPTEGYGVSNNHTYALHLPSWEESKFLLSSGKDVRVEIQLRY